jgi:2-amino-4-hydroxy-6-hydroxymethyldihydropteridine diphosphokinase
MIFVVLGLGSNAPWNEIDSVSILRSAVKELSHVLADISWSSVYKTKPMYLTEQEDFYNMVVAGNVGETVTPHSLLDKIHCIEALFGRNRTLETRNGPRPLDIDIERFGNEVLNDEDLVIPHPRMNERAFVLVPLLEILPESADSIEKRKYADFLKQLPDQGVILYLPKEKFIERR